MGTGVPATGCPYPYPTAGYSRGPVPCGTEIPPGKGQNGTGPGTSRELLAAVSFWTLRKGSAGRGRLRNGAVGDGHGQHRAGNSPGPAPTSVFRSSSWATAVEATATATAAEAATLPCLSLGSSFFSAGKWTKSGAATGWTYSAGKSPDLPWMAPNFHPVPGRRWGWPWAGSPGGHLPKSLCPFPPSPCTPSPFQGVWLWVLAGNSCGLALLKVKAQTKSHKTHHMQGHGAAPSATQGGNCRGASPCVRSVPKRSQTIPLRCDRGLILPRAPAPGGDTAQGSVCTPGTHRGTVWHPPKSWVPVFSSSRYITFLRTTQP